MKKIQLLFFVLMAAPVLMFGQKEYFIEYSNDYMTRLEYKKVDSKVDYSIIKYSASKNGKDKLIFDVGVENKKLNKRKPSATKSCKVLALDKNLATKINAKDVDVYIVKKEKGGYSISPVISASVLNFNGSLITYKERSFGMDYQINSLVMNENIADNKNLNEVYYFGNDFSDCKETHKFQKNPTTTCGEVVDMTMIPEIGILEQTYHYKVGDVSQETFRLKYINNLPVDNYIGAVCMGNAPTDPTITPITTTPPAATEVADSGSGSSSGGVEFYSLPPSDAAKTTASADYPDLSKDTTPKPKEEETTILEDLASKGGGYVTYGYYTLQPNETLYRVATRNGMKVEDLIALNDIKDPKNVPVYTKLRLARTTIPSEYDMGEDLAGKGGSAKLVNESPCTKKSRKGIHIVKPGESIFGIAYRYGYTVERFKKMNGLTSNELENCQELLTSDCNCPVPGMVPDATAAADDLAKKGVVLDKPKTQPEEYGGFLTDDIFAGEETMEGKTEKIVATETNHTVKKGETLYSIAKKYNVTVEGIMLDNGILDPSTLTVDQILVIK